MTASSSACAVMGILNVTPDSFSDGGRFVEHGSAVAHALRMLDEGATWIDIGGESTRPGADAVDAATERARTEPIIRAVLESRPDAHISIDTMKASVAEAALDAGATLVNDVSAGGDPAMFSLVAERRSSLCLMHMLGDPRTMQTDPRYDDVVIDVRDELLRRANLAIAAGVPGERIWIDPGLGFGKTLEHNLALLRHLDRFVETGYPVLVGASRKSFIGRLLDAEVDERLEGSLAAALWAVTSGAAMVRVHDVAATVRAVAVWEAIRTADPAAAAGRDAG